MHPKHTLYAIAWDMIRLPQYPRKHDGRLVTDQATAQQRLELKKACREYANERDWSLALVSQHNGEEEWQLSRWISKEGALIGSRVEHVGTLQSCCLHIVADDIKQTEPEDAGTEMAGDSP